MSARRKKKRCAKANRLRVDLLRADPLGIRIAVFPSMAAAKNKSSGLALLEAMVAAFVLVFTLTSLYAVFGHARNQLAEINENSAIQANLQARHESLRQSGWAKITNPTQLATMLATPLPATQSNIASITQEYIIVYPASVPYVAPAVPTPTPYFTVTRTGAGVTVTPAGFSNTSLVAQYQCNCVIGIDWSSRGRSHKREISTLFSKSGSP